MMMHNPPHPGETLREDVLPALEVGVSEAADRLGVSRQTLSAVLNGRQAITPEMAARLEAWIGAENGGRAEVWLAQQAAFDLWHVRQDKAAALSSIKRSGLAAVRNRAGEPVGPESAKAVDAVEEPHLASHVYSLRTQKARKVDAKRSVAVAVKKMAVNTGKVVMRPKASRTTARASRAWRSARRPARRPARLNRGCTP